MPFVAFAQKASHLYLYKKDCPGLRKGHKKTKKTIRVGIKQHTRAFQPIPDELRSRVSKPSVSLAMWELKRRKQEKLFIN